MSEGAWQGDETRCMQPSTETDTNTDTDTDTNIETERWRLIPLGTTDTNTQREVVNDVPDTIILAV